MYPPLKPGRVEARLKEIVYFLIFQTLQTAVVHTF